MFDATKYYRERYQNDKEFRSKFKLMVCKSQKKMRLVYRTLLLNALGKECSICRFSITDILEFHHINNDGKKNRMGLSNLKYYSENLEEAKEKLRIVCPNCHCILTHPIINTNGKTQRRKRNLMKLLEQSTCKKCNYSDIRGLQFDHKKGHGHQDKLKHKSLNAYYLARPNLAKETLEILCANCNRLKQRANWEFRGY